MLHPCKEHISRLTFSYVTPLVTAGEVRSHSDLPEVPEYARVRVLVEKFNQVKERHLAKRSAVLRFEEESKLAATDALDKYSSGGDSLPLRRLLHDSVAVRFWTAGTCSQLVHAPMDNGPCSKVMLPGA